MFPVDPLAGMLGLADDIAALSRVAEIVVLPPPCPLTVPPFDFSHADQLIRQGLADSRQFLDGAALPLAA